MAVFTPTSASQLQSSFVRFDAEFFRPEFTEVHKRVSAIPGVTPLGRFTEKITQGSNPKFSDSGLPCVNGKNVYFGTMTQGDPNFVSPAEFQRLSGYVLRRNDLVITLKHATKIGRAWIVENDEPRIFSRNIGLIRLRHNSPLTPTVLLLILWTKQGQLLLDRCATGGTTGQITLPMSELRRLPIPPISDNIQMEIDSLFWKSRSCIKNSVESYTQAQQLLEAELGLDKLTFQKPVGYTARFSELELSRRADAEFFKPEFQAMIDMVKNHSPVMLGMLFLIRRGVCIDPKKYNETYGRSFIRIKELSLTRPLTKADSIKIDEKHFSPKFPVANKGDYILAVIGATIGKISLITPELEGSIFSNNTACLTPKIELNYPNAYELILRSQIVQKQIQQRMAKTAQEKISDSELKRILIPALSEELLYKLERLVFSSKENYFQSKKLLDQAKSRVEQLIEEAVQA